MHCPDPPPDKASGDRVTVFFPKLSKAQKQPKINFSPFFLHAEPPFHLAETYL
jgi:hypothetical protein